MITAHSGSDGYSDNSLEFIQAVLDSDVDAFEIDCQLSDEGVLYLSHDPLVDIEGVLRLDDVFRLMNDSDNDSIILNVDCKDGRIGPLAVELASQHQILDRIVLSGSIVISDYDASFRPQLFYNLENSLEYQEDIEEAILAQTLRSVFDSGVRYIQLHYQWVTGELLELIHQHGLKLSVWTVNDLKLMDLLLKRGVFNVTSRRALEYINQYSS